MRLMKKMSVMAVCVMLILSIAGCGSKPTENPSSTAPAASSNASAKKDTLVVLSSENFLGNWDPTNHTTLSHLHAEWFIFNRLINMDTTTQEYKPELATEWKYKADNATLQVKLREGVKFHDGSTFDANDVKATIEKHSAKGSVTNAWWSEPMKATVIDNYTVEIIPESGVGYAGLINMLSMVPMMSEDDIKNNKLSKTYNGTGGYKFVEYKNDALHFTAFADCWEGAPKVKNVEYKYVPDPSTRLSALQSGEADIIERVESEQIPLLEADGNVSVIKQLTTEEKHLVFKWKAEFMNNIKLRQAICYAIDRETIVKNIMQGCGEIADSYLSPVCFGYAPIENFPKYDPEKAKKLLAEAGYPNGQGLSELTYITSVGFYPKTKEYGEYIVANLAAVGIKCKLIPEETATWNDHLYQENPSNMIDTGWCPPGLEPNLKMNPFYKSPGIESHYEDAELDAVMKKQSTTLDPEKRKEIIKNELFPMLAEKVPDFPLFTSMAIYGVSNRVKNFKSLPTTSFELKNVTLE